MQLSQIEQEELKQILQKRKPLNWNEEWEKVTTQFHQAFERRPQEEVEVDFQKALYEVRKDKNARRGLPPFSPVYGVQGRTL